jgi:hypothetical protein
VLYRVIEEHLEAFLETARRPGVRLTAHLCRRSWSRSSGTS